MNIFSLNDIRSIQTIIFMSARKQISSALIRSPHQGTSNEYHNICFHEKIRKNVNSFCLKKTTTKNSLLGAEFYGSVYARATV